MKGPSLIQALALFALLSLFPASAHALDVEVLRQSGPVDQRFNLVVLGDGYRSSDQAQLSSDAKGLIDYVFAAPPFKQYAQFFNVKLVHVISNQNGGDGGAYGAQRDTALGSYFNCEGTPRLLCVDDGKVEAAAAANVPEFNFALVVVNDPTYGGSGGAHPATSINAQSFEIVSHEIGHSLAGLADEYDSPDPGYPACNAQTDCTEGNVTLRNTRADVKWRAWIDAATPVPTPATNQYTNSVGLYEGARYLTSGAYRPWQDCKMRELGMPYCPVCTEQFVLHYWNLENIRMIESFTPLSPITSSDCKPIALSVTSPALSPSTYAYTWTVDGKADPDASAQLQVLPSTLMAGKHQISVLVQDKTSFVRTDPNKLLQDEQAWSIDVSTDGCSVGGSAGTGNGLAGGAGSAGQASAGAAGSSGGVSSAGAMSLPPAGGSPSVAGAPSVSGGSAGAASMKPPPPENVSCKCGFARAPSGSAYAALALAGLCAAGARRRRRRGATRARP